MPKQAYSCVTDLFHRAPHIFRRAIVNDDDLEVDAFLPRTLRKVSVSSDTRLCVGTITETRGAASVMRQSFSWRPR